MDFVGRVAYLNLLSEAFDVVGRAPDAVRVLGTVKWRERRPVTRDEVARLATAREAVPGSGGARLLAVSPLGAPDAGADVALDAEQLLSAWSSAL